MFTDQFVRFTESVKTINAQAYQEDDVILQDRFAMNQELLAAGTPEDSLLFPDAKKFPF